MALGPTGINAANFGSGAMPTLQQAKQFGTTPGITNPGNPAGNPPATAVGDGLYQARGAAGTFDANKYQTDQYQYPSDLMGNVGEYGGNYVIFYINIAVDSKLAKDANVQTVQDNTPRDNSGLAALAGKFDIGAAGAVAGAVVPGLAVAGVTGSLSKSTAVKTGGAAVIGGATLSQVASTFTARKLRLKTAIALHTPNNLQTSYSINYDEEDTDVFAMGMASVSLKKAAEQKGMSDIAAGITALGLKLPTTAGISKLTGLANNPRKEQIFKWVNFRTFTFDYQFYPRDAQEAQNVLNIIYQFKLHMHPEFKDSNNFLYIYPSEFDIFYYNNGQENLNINRHTSCVLTDMVVNYSPNAQFTAFEGGMPTQINVTLTFKELATLTKEKIQDGL